MVQVCWQKLYAWQQGRRIVLHFCWPPCFGKNCWPPSPSPLLCFMHLQNSVTLIDTLWNSLKLNFHMKNHTSSPKHRRVSGHYGTKEPQAMQNNNLLHSSPYIHPCAILYVPLINVKIKYQSKNKFNFMWQASFIDGIWSPVLHMLELSNGCVISLLLHIEMHKNALWLNRNVWR